MMLAASGGSSSGMGMGLGIGIGGDGCYADGEGSMLLPVAPGAGAEWSFLPGK